MDSTSLAAADGRPPSVSIALLWHSPNSGNLGVGALTVANMAIVSNVARELGLTPQFTIVSMADGEARYVSENQARLFTINFKSMLRPDGYWSMVGRQDCVLDIGAGDSFADIYGAKRFGFMWLSKAVALARRTPLLLSPQTIGPFTKTAYRALARMVLTPAAAVIARDHLSLQLLQSLAPQARAVLAVDVAFALPFADRSGERRGTRTRIGVNVSGLLFNSAEAGANRFGLDFDYAKLMRRYLGDLAKREDVEVHLISHVSSPAVALEYDDDHRVALRLKSEFPQVIVAPTFAGPSEAKSYISSLDFLVAGRMHACIAAFSSGVPVVPVAYSRKFSGLFGMLGYDWIVPMNGLADEGALAFLHDCLDRRDELERDLSTGMGKVDEALDRYRDELRRLLKSVTKDRA